MNVAEGYHGESYENEPPVDAGREGVVDEEQRLRLHRKFGRNARLQMLGLDWFIPRDER